MTTAKNTLDCGNNFLYPTGFKVTIDRDYFPNLQFYAQAINHPSVQLEATETGFGRVIQVPFLGESITFGNLTMEVIADENLQSYKEIIEWIERAVENPHRPPAEGLLKNKEERPAPYNDITISILTSSNNPNKQFRYINAFPVDIGEMQFTATNGDQAITFPVTFRFDYFEFS